MKFIKPLILIGIILFTGCSHQKRSMPTIESLIDKSPELKVAFSNKNGGLKLIRSVALENPNIIIQLFSQSEPIDDKQQIIMVTNDQKSCIIPLLSNAFQNYWHFKFDNLNPKSKEIHTSFEIELNNCIDSLNLNDTLGTAYKVATEILTSLLHCREIELSDSSEVHTINFTDNGTLEEENSDSCSKRFKRNWQEIASELNKDIRYKSAYWDKSNNRIYQLDFTNFKRRQKNRFKIITFRQDCIVHFLSL